MIELEKDKFQTIPATITDNVSQNIWSFENSMAMWIRAIEKHSGCTINEITINRMEGGFESEDVVIGVKAKITFK